MVALGEESHSNLRRAILTDDLRKALGLMMDYDLVSSISRRLFERQ